jgi:predicted transcriptional regulator
LLTGRARVLLAIARDPTASWSTIATETGLHPKTVQRSIDALVSGGFISRTRTGRGSTYGIFFNAPLDPMAGGATVADLLRAAGVGLSDRRRSQPDGSRTK